MAVIHLGGAQCHPLSVETEISLRVSKAPSTYTRRIQGILHNCLTGSEFMATVNQHPPAHHEGWMVSGQETVFCWVPVP
jgi:hypothetical protein